MRSDIVRLYKSVHSWVGILSGLFLFIAFYAGALTVFKAPLTRWLSPPSAERFVPLDEMPKLLERSLASRPELAAGFTIHLQPSEQDPASLAWRVRPRGGDEHDALGGRFYRASLDSVGEARVSEVHPVELTEFIDTLHRVVGLPVDSDEARWLMGVVCALYALALVSGVIILLPSLVKDFFALRVGHNLKRMWLDAHNVVGIVSLPFHVVMAITAAVFAFHDGIYTLQDRLFHDSSLASAWSAPRKPPQAPAARRPGAMLPPAELLARAREGAEGFEAERMQYMQLGGPRATVRVWGKDPRSLAPRPMGGFVALDPYTGEVLSRDFMPGRQDAVNFTLASFFALHFATFGGTPLSWIYFLLALAGAWLFYSGNLLWIESRRRKIREGVLPGQTRQTRWLAALTVGVCIGCVAGISLAIAAGKFLHALVGDLGAWQRGLYYGVFFISIGWAFLRGAGRGAVELLWMAVAATAAIPLASLLALCLPDIGWWAHRSVAAIAVDLAAATGALGLAWMARATARRVATGPADSVWAPPRG